jgi:hypothetical protein
MLELLKKIAAAAAEEAVALVVEALTHLHLRVSALEKQQERPTAQDPTVHLVPAFPDGVPPELEVSPAGSVPVCGEHGQSINSCPPRCRTVV